MGVGRRPRLDANLRCRRDVSDDYRRGQFVSLSLVRTGGPRHRCSTGKNGGRFPAWTARSRREADELASWTAPRGEILDAHRRGRFVSLSLVRTGRPRHRFSTMDLDGGRTKTRSAAEFPRGPPVRAAKRTNWLLGRGRASSSWRPPVVPVAFADARSNGRATASCLAAKWRRENRANLGGRGRV
jgi:hypothetical protein